MWRTRKVVAAPSAEPVSLAEAKLHLRVDAAVTDEDSTITAMIVAARAHIENYTGLAIATQTIELLTDRWDDMALLPVAPVQSATIAYLDQSGATVTLDASAYALVGSASLQPAIVPAVNAIWPSTADRADAIKLTLACGYSAPPEPVKLAIRMLVAQWFVNREAMVVAPSIEEIPVGIAAILANYRLFG